MKEWFSASELVGLPGMPTTDRGIQKKARREGWISRPRRARGGGQEVSLSSLPSEAKCALAATQTNIETRESAAARAAGARKKLAEQAQTTLNNSADGLAQLAILTGNARDRAEARLAILRAAEAFARRAGISKDAAYTRFIAYYIDGAIDVADWVREQVPSLCKSSLYRWRTTAKKEGAGRLGGDYGNRAGSSKIDSQLELSAFSEAMLAEYPHVSAKALHRALTARFADNEEISLPGKRACERWLARWKDQNKSLYLAVANPDGWNNKYRPAFGSASEDVIRINQRWELDSTPADLMLTDGRHHLVGVIDIFSRRPRLVVSKTSTAASVASVFRRAVLDWGVPEVVKTDNGSDYVSHHITRVWEFFGIEQRLCTPYSGWEKPHIERLFGTFMRDLIELAPGYCGHNVADRQAIESQASFAKRLQDPDEVFDIRMTSTELQTMCDRWTNDIYEREVHSSLGCTPAEKAAGQPVKRVDNERVLDVLLSRAPDGGTRVVGKKGISVDGYQYIHAALAGERVMGEPVQVLLDEHDLGRIYCFADLGDGWEYLCTAECPEITGISRQAVAGEVRARNDRAVRDARNQMKRAKKKYKTADIVEDILAHGQRQGDRIGHLPGRGEPYESDGINAARDAIQAQDNPANTGPERIDPAQRKQLAEQLAAEDAQPEELTPRELFASWQAMIGRTQPDSAERQDWQIYETSIAFQVRYEAAYDTEFAGHQPGAIHDTTAKPMRRIK